MKCFVCDTNRNLIKETYFSNKCSVCDLEMSNLKNRFGADVKGIKNLRYKNFQKILSKILKIKKNPLILEVGSGDGMFIDMALKKKIKITGIEPEQKYLLNKNLKKFIFKRDFPFKKSQKTWINYFDFVVFNDTFEHFKGEELHSVIIQSKKYLKKKGFLIINMPTSTGKIYRFSKFLAKFGIYSFYERLWQKNFSSPHQFYFNEKNISNILYKYKFKKIYSHFLNVVDRDGLYKRISISHKNIIIKLFLFTLIYFSCSLINLYSNDINLLIFKKI